MQRRWLDTDSEHWIWFLVCVQGRRCQTWQHLRDKTSESWAQLWVSASPGGVVKLASSFPIRARVFFWAETRSEPWRQTALRTVISSGSLRLSLRCFVWVHFFFCFYLFAPIAAFLVHELSSTEILTLKLYWVHIVLAYSLHSRYIVVVGA